jgi:Protein of unknown function (DUF1353)
MNPTDPKLEGIDGDSYIVAIDFPVILSAWLEDIQFIIPAGEKTDIASVPWWFRWAYDRASLNLLGPVAHDFLCRCEGRFTNLAGKVIQLSWFKVHVYFLLILLIDGVPDRRAFLAFLAVLIGCPRWSKQNK